MVDAQAAALDIAVQRDASGTYPADADFVTWAQTALARAGHDSGELTIRLVDAAESQALNREYRGKDKPTNVLSFGYDMPGLLGDLAICAPVVRREAVEQGKAVDAHWAHMTVHGCLHLCGYDHVDDADAAAMEALEIAVLASLNLPNPYTV